MRRLTLLALLLGLLLPPLPLPLPLLVEARAGARAAQKSAAQRVITRRLAQQRAKQDVRTPPCLALDVKLRTAPRPHNGGQDLAVVRPSDVAECARTRTVFTNDTLLQALQDLNSTIIYFQNFYSLLPLAKKSPDPDLPSAYDIVGALRNLSGRPWVYREELYGNISQAVDRLQDGHTAFAFVSNVPTYYRLVLPLVAVVASGQPTVRAVPQPLNGQVYAGTAAGAPFNFNASVYYGARVLSIEGTPAWSYMLGWVRDNAGGYHNYGQKVNEAFARMTFNSNRRTYSIGVFSGRMVNPGMDFLQMVLQRNGSTTNETVSVPWLAAVDMTYAPFADATTFRASARQLRDYHPFPHSHPPSHPEDTKGTAGGVTAHRGLNARRASASGAMEGSPEVRRGLAQEGGGGSMPPSILMRRREGVPERFRLEPPARLQAPVVAQPAGTKISGATDLWEVYQLADNKTGVVAISTFSLGDSAGNPLNATFINGTLKAFDTLNRSNCTQIIIDLSGNPGGYVQFGTWFMQMLLGSDAVPFVPRVSAFDAWRFLAGAPFAEDLARQQYGLWAPSNWLNSSGDPYTTETQDTFYFPTEKIKYPGSRTPAVFSRPFLYPQESLEGVGPAFPNKRIVLFSDGLCFSTCNTVASTLKRSFGIPLVTAGGLYTTSASGGPVKMVFAGAGGGFVAGDVEKDVFSSFGNLVFSNKAPKKFSGPVALGMRLAAGFYGGARIPIEFSALKPDFRVNYTMANVAEPTMLYSDVAKFFSK